ncbi:uncharacterized protein ACOB8E_014560 isoform 1-T2 [Sarcophilus harrisii]
MGLLSNSEPTIHFFLRFFFLGGEGVVGPSPAVGGRAPWAEEEAKSGPVGAPIGRAKLMTKEGLPIRHGIPPGKEQTDPSGQAPSVPPSHPKEMRAGRRKKANEKGTNSDACWQSSKAMTILGWTTFRLTKYTCAKPRLRAPDTPTPRRSKKRAVRSTEEAAGPGRRRFRSARRSPLSSSTSNSWRGGAGSRDAHSGWSLGCSPPSPHRWEGHVGGPAAARVSHCSRLRGERVSAAATTAGRGGGGDSSAAASAITFLPASSGSSSDRHGAGLGPQGNSHRPHLVRRSRCRRRLLRGPLGLPGPCFSQPPPPPVGPLPRGWSSVLQLGPSGPGLNVCSVRGPVESKARGPGRRRRPPTPPSPGHGLGLAEPGQEGI